MSKIIFGMGFLCGCALTNALWNPTKSFDHVMFLIFFFCILVVYGIIDDMTQK